MNSYTYLEQTLFSMSPTILPHCCRRHRQRLLGVGLAPSSYIGRISCCFGRWISSESMSSLLKTSWDTIAWLQVNLKADHLPLASRRSVIKSDVRLHQPKHSLERALSNYNIFQTTFEKLHLTVTAESSGASFPLAGLCEELEAIAGHNTCWKLWPSQITLLVIEEVEILLVKSGWSALS